MLFAARIASAASTSNAQNTAEVFYENAARNATDYSGSGMAHGLGTDDAGGDTYVDSAMVGWLGAAATAAIGTTTTINWLVNTSVSALEIGFLAYIAREYGANSCCPSQPLHPEEYLRPFHWLLSNLRHISPEARRMP